MNSSLSSLIFFFIVFCSDPSLGYNGQVERIEKLKNEILNVHVLDQFLNPANIKAHFQWTGMF